MAQDPNFTRRLPDGLQFSSPFFSPRSTPDGVFVVFTTAADICGLGTPPGRRQVYRLNRPSGECTLVSVDNDGNAALFHCFRPSIDEDGDVIVFDTTAALDPGDTNGLFDVYARLLPLPPSQNSPLTTRISIRSDGAEPDGDSRWAAVSGRPRTGTENNVVVFTSNASNLVASDANGTLADVFLAVILQPLDLSIVSLDNAGAQSTFASTNFRTGDGATRASLAVDRDGRFVVFSGAPCDWGGCAGPTADCLCPQPDGDCAGCVLGQTEEIDQVYIRDTQMSTTLRVSRFSDGGGSFVAGNDNSTFASIRSDDSSALVAFTSRATNFPRDTDSFDDVFVIDQANIADPIFNPVRVSTPVGGAASDGNSTAATIGSGLRFVSFESSATNLIASDSNAVADVFIADLAPEIPSVVRFSVSSAGAEANGSSASPDIMDRLASAQNGVGVVYESLATNLTPGDTNSTRDIFDTLSRTFIRGDADNDGTFQDQDDFEFLQDFLFFGGLAPPCMDAADFNDDGGVNVGDLSASPPFPPPNTCGMDFTQDTLTCNASACD